MCACVCVCPSYKSSQKLEKMKKHGKLILLSKHTLLFVIRYPMSLWVSAGQHSHTFSLIFSFLASVSSSLLYNYLPLCHSNYFSSLIFNNGETPNHCLSHSLKPFLTDLTYLAGYLILSSASPCIHLIRMVTHLWETCKLYGKS